jgi:hypothetical protein
MSEEDIRRATAAALAAKPVVIGLKRLKKPVKPKWLLGEEDVGDEPVDPDQVKDEDGNTEAPQVRGQRYSLWLCLRLVCYSGPHCTKYLMYMKHIS